MLVNHECFGWETEVWSLFRKAELAECSHHLLTLSRLDFRGQVKFQFKKTSWGLGERIFQSVCGSWKHFQWCEFPPKLKTVKKSFLCNFQILSSSLFDFIFVWDLALMANWPLVFQFKSNPATVRRKECHEVFPQKFQTECSLCFCCTPQSVSLECAAPA